MEHKETPIQTVKSFSFGAWAVTFFTFYGVFSFTADILHAVFTK